VRNETPLVAGNSIERALWFREVIARQTSLTVRRCYAPPMNALVLAMLAAWGAWIVWEWKRRPETRMLLGGLVAFSGTNVFLMERGAALVDRLMPCLVASAVGAVVVTSWQLWRDAHAGS